MDKITHEEHSTEKSPLPETFPKSETECCGPGCACNVRSGGKGVKIIISLLVVAVVIGVLVFKYLNVTSSTSNDTAVAKASNYSVTPAAPGATPESAKQLSLSGSRKGNMTVKREISASPNASDGEIVGAVEQKVKNGIEAQPGTATGKIGENLSSFEDLNKVALSQDAVFIFIPSKKNEAVQGTINTAVLASQKALKAQNITAGIYTLPTSSPDYSTILKQVQAPAVIIATKGKGMAAVTGDITESKLLQAFMTTLSAGGCCPTKKPSDTPCKVN